MKILCDPVPELFKIIPNVVTIVVGNNTRVHRISQLGVCGDGTAMRRMVELAMGRQNLVAKSMLEAKEAHLLKENGA